MPPKMIKVDEAALRAKLTQYMKGFAKANGLTVLTEEDIKYWVETEITVLKGEVTVI